MTKNNNNDKGTMTEQGEHQKALESIGAKYTQDNRQRNTWPVHHMEPQENIDKRGKQKDNKIGVQRDRGIRPMGKQGLGNGACQIATMGIQSEKSWKKDGKIRGIFGGLMQKGKIHATWLVVVCLATISNLAICIVCGDAYRQKGVSVTWPN